MTTPWYVMIVRLECVAWWWGRYLMTFWYMTIVRAECVAWCEGRYLWPLDTWQLLGRSVPCGVRKGTWRPFDTWQSSGRSVMRATILRYFWWSKTLLVNSWCFWWSKILGCLKNFLDGENIPYKKLLSIFIWLLLLILNKIAIKETYTL